MAQRLAAPVGIPDSVISASPDMLSVLAQIALNYEDLARGRLSEHSFKLLLGESMDDALAVLEKAAPGVSLRDLASGAWPR